ncbi:MAG: hypothetical protein ABI792_08295, partial [bacterium]
DSLGKKSFDFSFPVNSTNYYISLQHRNMIETWSAGQQMFVNDTLNYDFTTAATQAFGNNLKLVDTSPLKYACYNGDVNLDGIINLSDILLVHTNTINFVSGYVVTDLTGDNITNLSDLIIVANNGESFVVKVTP